MNVNLERISVEMVSVEIHMDPSHVCVIQDSLLKQTLKIQGVQV